MRDTIQFFPRLFLQLGVVGIFIAVSLNASADPIRVACVGDSITYGSGTPHPAREGYPAVLKRMMGSHYDVRNFGIGSRTMLKKGDYPYWKEQIFTNALNFKPDLLVILLGTNDSKHPTKKYPTAPDNWKYHDEYAANYEEMIADFRKASPGVKIFVCVPLPAFPGRWGITEFTMTNAVAPLVRQVAQKTGATLIDLHTPMAAHPEWFADTVHPNVIGAEHLAAIVYHALTGKTAPKMDKPNVKHLQKK